MAENFRIKWAPWQPDRPKDAVPAASSPRPRGVMSPYLGRQYTLAEVQAPHRCDEEGMESFFPSEAEMQRMAVVRAYEVSHLMGATYEARDEEDVFSGLERFLATALPGFEWRVELDDLGQGGRSMLFKKYQVVHANLDAPDDLAMGQPMSLEVKAEMVAAGGKSLGLRVDPQAYGEWMMSRIASRMSTGHYQPIPGPIVMQITQATYANVAATGIGIGFFG